MPLTHASFLSGAEKLHYEGPLKLKLPIPVSQGGKRGGEGNVFDVRQGGRRGGEGNMFDVRQGGRRGGEGNVFDVRQGGGGRGGGGAQQCAWH